MNAPTTLPLINGSYANYPPIVTLPGYPHSLKPFPSLQLQEHISGAGGRDSIKYPGKKNKIYFILKITFIILRNLDT